MAFKEDEDFARFLTMGAYATAKVSADLETRGHVIIELERYAKANKIWATKVKRLRLADLLCIQCGRRFESKGKTKLELKLSHSPKDPRQWWAGLRKTDVFAFVRVRLTESSPDLGEVVYVTRQALHDAEASLKAGVRKSIADGAEADVSWPITVPTQDGKVLALGTKKIFVLKADGRRQAYQGGAWDAYYPLRAVGETFKAGDALASSVAIADVTCAGAVWDWKADIELADPGDRFPAVKAARWRGPDEAARSLRAILDNDSNDWRLRLEAAASLAPIDDTATEYMLARALDNSAKEGEQMEAVFVLSELETVAAVEALKDIADPDNEAPSEVRAAAAWGIGLGALPTPAFLLPLLSDDDDLVALHAAAAMPNPLPASITSALITAAVSGAPREAASASHLLARNGQVEALVQMVDSTSEEVRALAILAIGDAEPQEVGSAIDSLDPETATTIRTLWARRDDWMRAPETDGALDVLSRQQVRL